jgi:hypothetical protein
MGNGRKSRTTGAAGYESNRKHLTGREVEKLIEATKGGAGLPVSPPKTLLPGTVQ